MSESGISETVLKRILKEAVTEVLDERRAFLRDVIEEVLADFEMVEDVREVKHSGGVRGLFAVSEGEA